jgi:hypothetical protein
MRSGNPEAAKIDCLIDVYTSYLSDGSKLLEGSCDVKGESTTFRIL